MSSIGSKIAFSYLVPYYRKCQCYEGDQLVLDVDPLRCPEHLCPGICCLETIQPDLNVVLQWWCPGILVDIRRRDSPASNISAEFAGFNSSAAV